MPIPQRVAWYIISALISCGHEIRNSTLEDGETQRRQEIQLLMAWHRGQEGHIALLAPETQYITTEPHWEEMPFYSLHTHSFNRYLLNINVAGDAVRQS